MWDRWFGTFQEELENVPPQYGVLKPARTWNPILINFQHLWRLIQDAWRTANYWDKLRIWFMPTGWRPSDVAEKYPVAIITDVYQFQRYATRTSPLLNVFVIFQLTVTLALLWFMFFNYTAIGFDGLLIFGAFVFTGIYAYTSLMDRLPIAAWLEIIRGVLAIVFIYHTGDWFGLDNYINNGSLLMVIYFLLTLLFTLYFTFFENKSVNNGLAL